MVTKIENYWKQQGWGTPSNAPVKSGHGQRTAKAARIAMTDTLTISAEGMRLLMALKGGAA